MYKTQVVLEALSLSAAESKILRAVPGQSKRAATSSHSVSQFLSMCQCSYSYTEDDPCLKVLVLFIRTNYFYVFP